MAQPSLATQINTATQANHTLLNRLLTTRLPLALPPHQSDPSLLGHGLSVFAEIFFAFEIDWFQIEWAVSNPTISEDDADEHLDSASSLISAIAKLRPEGLARSQRLRYDLADIDRRTQGSLPSVRNDANVQKIIQTMRDELEGRPHLFVAYAWVMYMAIFSGGRWIRATVEAAGPEYWVGADGPREFTVSASPEAAGPKLEGPSMTGLSFLRFEGEEDGEDIKMEFKRRVEALEGLLSEAERREIVRTSVGLFERCVLLVGVVDAQVKRRERIERFKVPVAVVLLLLGLLGLFWRLA